MTLSLLPPRREGRAHVRGAWLRSTGRPRCTARGPPSRAKMLEENLWCLLRRRGLPPCLLGRHCWFSPVCASSPVVVSASVGWEEPSGPIREVGSWRGGARGFYSNDHGAFVLEALILLIAYHVVALHHAVRGPCGKARVVLPATRGFAAVRRRRHTNKGNMAASPTKDQVILPNALPDSFRVGTQDLSLLLD
ncbi:hypothetical protein BHM03_00004570 [Ensete ventricosum]|nr:hypothetical protein BHM03_00004570 [Ensete ventricosum]